MKVFLIVANDSVFTICKKGFEAFHECLWLALADFLNEICYKKASWSLLMGLN